MIVTLFNKSYSEDKTWNDKVIATVNNEIILENDLEKHINIFFLLSKLTENNISRYNKKFREDLLKDIIINKIQLKLANKYKIKIENYKVEQIFNNYAKKEEKSISDYKIFLKNKNISDKILIEYIKESLTIDKLQKELLYPDITISNTEIENFFNFQQNIKNINNTEYLILYLSLSNIFKNNINNKIKWIINLMDKTQNYNEIPKRIKFKFNNINFTNINWKKTENIPILFIKYLPTIIHRKTIGPIYSNEKFHFIKLLGKKLTISDELLEIHIKHILIKTHPKIFKHKNNIKLHLNNIRKKLLNDYNYSKIKYSLLEKNYNSYKVNNITNINKRNVSNTFYNNILSLSNGELSYPFKSELGWHIVEVINKKYMNKSIKQLMIRNKIEKILINNKFNQLKEKWLKTLKKESIIQILSYNHA